MSFFYYSGAKIRIYHDMQAVLEGIIDDFWKKAPA
jgi:hypothetical protein